ncbi:MAG TPA: hypothetical protein VF187_01280 [Gemmatimonadales bacterium]
MPRPCEMARSGFLSVVVLSGAAASLPAQSPSATDALLAAERALSDASDRDGFPAAMARGLAADAAVLWPGAPVVQGPSQTGTLLSAQRILDSIRITWQPLAVELSADSAFGVTWGVAAVTRQGAPTRLARYIAAWRREQRVWKLAAFAGLGITPVTATALPPGFGPVRLPPLPPAGPAKHFIAADLAFARHAADSGAGPAFTRWAAPEAVTLGGGLLTRGPLAIGKSVQGPRSSRWQWHPVVAGASADGDLGFTVGESEITTEGAPTSYGKYLTIWRRLPGGESRFLTDGGNPRPPSP